MDPLNHYDVILPDLDSSGSAPNMTASCQVIKDLADWRYSPHHITCPHDWESAYAIADKDRFKLDREAAPDNARRGVSRRGPMRV